MKELAQRKYDIDEWAIDECKDIYYMYGDTEFQCEFSIKNKPFIKGFIKPHVDEYCLSFEYNINERTYVDKYCVDDLGYLVDTFPHKDCMVINDKFNVVIKNPISYNILCGILKYANYLYTNHMILFNDPLDEYEEVVGLDSVSFNEIFKAFFSSNKIDSLNLGSVNVESWDMNNKVEDEYFGNLSLVMGLADKNDMIPIGYMDALKKPMNLMIFILVEGVARLGLGMSQRIKIYTKASKYEIFLTNNHDNVGGYNIEFYKEEEYKKALVYLYIASLKEDYSKYLTINNILPREKETPYEKLNNLVGLEAIKTDVNNLVNLMKMQIRRKEQGLKPVPVSLHLVFSGNPGTGKTTIARILAEIYKDIGVLSKGQLIEVDRSGLVAGYVGQTAIKTQEKINEALGGILFIDEAYTLAKDGNDYGQEAIDTILKAMEDYREDFIVIVAGYSECMVKFINSNPGLKSRFNKYIIFPDYSADELIQIFMRMCNEYKFELTDDAKPVMREKILAIEAEKGDNFANARDIRNMFEEVITRQATRLSTELTEDILKIKAEDFG